MPKHQTHQKHNRRAFKVKVLYLQSQIDKWELQNERPYSGDKMTSTVTPYSYQVYRYPKAPVFKSRKRQAILNTLLNFTKSLIERMKEHYNRLQPTEATPINASQYIDHVAFGINRVMSELEPFAHRYPTTESYTTDMFSQMDQFHFVFEDEIITHTENKQNKEINFDTTPEKIVINVRADYMLLKALWSINRCYICSTRVGGNRFYSRKENKDMALKYVKTAIECMHEIFRSYICETRINVSRSCSRNENKDIALKHPETAIECMQEICRTEKMTRNQIENPEPDCNSYTSQATAVLRSHIHVIMRQLISLLLNLLPQIQSSELFTIGELDEILTAPQYIQDEFYLCWNYIKEQTGQQQGMRTMIEHTLSEFIQALHPNTTDISCNQQLIELTIVKLEQFCNTSTTDEKYVINRLNEIDQQMSDPKIRADYMMLKGLLSISRCSTLASRLSEGRLCLRTGNKNMALEYAKTAIKCILEISLIRRPNAASYTPIAQLIPILNSYLEVIKQELINLLPQMHSSDLFKIHELKAQAPAAPQHIQDEYNYMWKSINVEAVRQLEQQERCRQPQPHR